MKRTLTALALAAVMLLTACGGANGRTKNAYNGGNKTTMTIASEEYDAFTGDLANFPVSFVYGGTAYKGFGRNFKLIKKTSEKGELKTENDFTFLHADGKLSVTLKTAFYPDYDAYEWTVYFSAAGGENTAVLENVLAADMEIGGADPALKGINGDYGYLYSPYERGATELKRGVRFEATSGRSTAYGFPYFNLEYDGGGTLLAFGWQGTWRADFKTEADVTRVKATGTIGLKTYLKPGETVRTPLVAAVRYYKRDEAVSVNAWRRWFIDCNMPKEGGRELKPKVSVCLPFDRDDPSLDTLGAVVMKSFQNMYKNGFKPDIFWMDAGWYPDVYGNSLAYIKDNGEAYSDWYPTGNWTVDKRQYANFAEICDYVHQNGGKNMLWFEPERIGNDDVVRLENALGIQPEWLLFQQSRNQILLDLGNPDALEYIFGKICAVIDENGIDYYREDFNMDPIDNWKIADALQGSDRVGITENLHVQGHIKLWDMLLERYPNMIIDSCASGGNRNDLETMRRAVPMHRTDSEEFNTANTSLSMNYGMFKWIPYFGSAAYDRNTWTSVERYNSRAGYGGVYKAVFTFNTPAPDLYRDLTEYVKEYYKFGEYLLSDYYPLTDHLSPSDLTGWTAWEFFDPEKDEGAIQLFRRDECNVAQRTFTLKGFDRNKSYSLTNGDGAVLASAVSGAVLADSGFTFTIDVKRGSDVVFIAPAADNG